MGISCSVVSLLPPCQGAVSSSVRQTPLLEQPSCSLTPEFSSAWESTGLSRPSRVHMQSGSCVLSEF